MLRPRPESRVPRGARWPRVRKRYVYPFWIHQSRRGPVRGPELVRQDRGTRRLGLVDSPQTGVRGPSSRSAFTCGSTVCA